MSVYRFPLPFILLLSLLRVTSLWGGVIYRESLSGIFPEPASAKFIAPMKMVAVIRGRWMIYFYLVVASCRVEEGGGIDGDVERERVGPYGICGLDLHCHAPLSAAIQPI